MFLSIGEGLKMTGKFFLHGLKLCTLEKLSEESLTIVILTYKRLEPKLYRINLLRLKSYAVLTGYQWNPNSENYQWRGCTPYEGTKKNCPRGEPCLADTRYIVLLHTYTYITPCYIKTNRVAKISATI